MRLGRLAGQRPHHALAARAQRPHRLEQRRLVAEWREDAACRRGARGARLLGEAGERAQIRAEAGRRPRAPEGGADVVVSPSARDVVAVAGHEGAEDDARVVAVAAQLREVHVHRLAAAVARQALDEGGEPRERVLHLGPGGQHAARLVEHLGPAVEPGQGGDGLERRPLAVEAGEHGRELGARLALQQLEERLLGVPVEAGAARERAEDADVAEVEVHLRHAGGPERLEHEEHDLEIGLDARVAVELATDLQRAACAAGPFGTCAQHGAEVAQAHGTLAPQAPRLDARHLRRHVGADAEHAPRERVRELEGVRLEGVARAREQGLEVLDEGRDHELVAPGCVEVEEVAAQGLDARRLGGQQLLDALGQQPAARVHGPPLRCAGIVGHGGSSAREVEEQQARAHRGKAHEAQGAVVERGDREHGPPPAAGAQEGRDSLEHQGETERADELLPEHGEAAPPLTRPRRP